MPRACSICTHVERDAMDRALVAGESAPRIAALYRVSPDSVTRHRATHLPRLLARAERQAQAHADSLAGQQAEQDAREQAHAIDVVQQLKAINAASIAVLAEARRAGDGDLALKAVDRVQRQIELQAKLLGDLDERPTMNVLLMPEWLAVRAALLDALRPYPDARAAVAGRLRVIEGGRAAG